MAQKKCNKIGQIKIMKLLAESIMNLDSVKIIEEVFFLS